MFEADTDNADQLVGSDVFDDHGLVDEGFDPSELRELSSVQLGVLLEATVSELASRTPAGLGDVEVMGLAVGLQRARSVFDAAEGAVLGVLSDHKITKRHRGLSAAMFVAHATRSDDRKVQQRVRRGTRARAVPVLFRAWRTGRISTDHVDLLLAALANKRITTVVWSHLDDLIDTAAGSPFGPWKRDLEQQVARWDHDGGYDPDDDPELNRLHYNRTLDGVFHLSATFTGRTALAVAHQLAAETEQLRRQYQHTADEHGGKVEVPSRSRLQAEAFARIVQRGGALSDKSLKLPSPEFVVIIEPDGTATTPDGTPVPPAVIATEAPFAFWRPLWVDHDHNPLNLGRAQRFATPEQRHALIARDGGCGFPGCTRTGRHLAAHHGLEWKHGGPTNIDNLCLLCAEHHDLAHSNGWTCEIRDGWTTWTTPTGNQLPGQRHGRTRGEPRVSPPPTCDDG